MSFSTFFGTLRRQWFVVAVVLLIGVLAFILTWPHFRKFTATSTMLASNSPATSSGVLDPSRDPISSAVGLNDLQTLATSEVVLNRVAASLGFSKSKAAALANEVKAKAVFDSDILPIAVTDADPQTAIDTANGIANELSAYSQRLATGRYDELISNLNGQIAERRKDLAAVDKRIQEVSSGDFYVTPDAGTTAVNASLIALEQREQQLETQVEGDQAAAAVTAQQPNLSRSVARQEILAEDPSVVAQRAQLGKDISAMNVGLASYSLNFPGLRGYILEVRREAAAVEAAENHTAKDPGQSESYVAAEIATNKAQAALASDSAQLASVRDQLAGLQTHLTDSAVEGSDIAQLRRAKAAGEDVYTDLSQRLARAKADRAQAGAIGSVVVIDHASDALPALLGRPAVLGAAIAAIFLWVAISLAFLVDGADDRLRTAEAIEKLYGKPVFMPVG
jgi:capsular polysaccharide biosynthesis protein